jgi:outer membrane protein TolC
MPVHRALVAFLFAPIVAAGAPPLTLDRVQQLAVDNQPALAALDANVRAAREGAAAEGQLPDPRLKLALQNVPVENLELDRDPMTQVMIGIEQPLPGGDKRVLRKRRGDAEADQLAAELAAQRHQIQRDAALAFLNLQGTLRQRALLATLHQQTEEQAEAARIGAIAGKGKEAEVFAARQMATMVRDRGSELAMQEARARAELARWIGAAAETDVALDPPRPLPPPALAELKKRLDQHPSHTAQARTVAMAEAELALAREAKTGDKSIEFGYGKRARKFNDMFTIQFAMDLPLAPRDRQDRGIAARQAQVERAAAMREDHLRMLGAELSATYAEWQLTGERLQRMETELLPGALQRVEAALGAYRAGRGELAAVMEARRAETEARLQQIQLDTQITRARARLAWFEQMGEDHGQHR